MGRPFGEGPRCRDRIKFKVEPRRLIVADQAIPFFGGQPTTDSNLEAFRLRIDSDATLGGRHGLVTEECPPAPKFGHQPFDDQLNIQRHCGFGVDRVYMGEREQRSQEWSVVFQRAINEHHPAEAG